MLNNLKILRESKGYTQQQLSEMIGVSQQTLQKYETQKHEPDIESLKKLADIFGVTVDYLVSHGRLPRRPHYGRRRPELRHKRERVPDNRELP